MTLIELDDVVMLTEGTEHLAGSSLEVPQASSTRDAWSIPLSGWVLGRDEPVTSIEVVHQQVAVRSGSVDLERVDVAWAYPDIPHANAAGFTLRVGATWLPETFVLRLEAGFANGYRVPFALIRGRRAALQAPLQPNLRPIAVTSLGRSGSTLVMRMLASHPEIVVHGGHPYSSRPAAYWLHTLRVLSDPAPHPENFLEDLHAVGGHPLNGALGEGMEEVEQWFGREYVEELAGFSQRAIDQFYVRLARSQRLADPLFFAEKHEPGHVSRLLAGLYPEAREILLVRDFRDMACSMIAFYRKRGQISYGRDRVDSDEEFVASLAPAVARLVAYMHERPDSALVVRYEDLVSAPEEQVATILSYLGLDASAETQEALVEATADSPELEMHRTSVDAASSVGRHLGEMPPSVLGAAEEAFGPALEAFGYERAAGGAAQERGVYAASG